MALVISGRVTHPPLQPTEVQAALAQHLPGLSPSVPDFAVDRAACRLEFFCNTSSTLDFSVTLLATAAPPPAEVAVLVREADSIAAVVIGALSNTGDASIAFCVLEDEYSRSRLLSWVPEPSPLSSRPAKLSYILCLALLVLGAFLMQRELLSEPSAERTDDIIGLLLSTVVPALTLPLPFLFEQLAPREDGRWVFTNPLASHA